MNLETRKPQEAGTENTDSTVVWYCPLCKTPSIYVEGTDTGVAHESYGRYFAVCSECDYKAELFSD